MTAEYRLVIQNRPERRKMAYKKRDKNHAHDDLAYYLDPTNYTGRHQPAAWVETREVTKWAKDE